MLKAASLDAWRDKVSVDLCGRKGFRGLLPLLDVHGSCSKKSIRLCFASIMVGRCLEWFSSWTMVRSQVIPCRFCGAPDGAWSFILGMYLSSSC